MKRRNFLKNCAFGLGAATSSQLESVLLASDAQRLSDAETVRLENRLLCLEYDLRSGCVSLGVPGGSPILSRATAAAVLSTGTVLASDPRYVRQSRVGRSTELGGVGNQLTVDCRDTAATINLELRMTLLDDSPGALVELVLTNVSGHDLNIHHAEPVRALLSEKAGCQFGASQERTAVRRILTNGYLYFDPGNLLDVDAYAHKDFTSWWNAAFHIPTSQETLVAGHLDNRDAEGQIIAGWDLGSNAPAGPSAFNFTARCLFNQGFVLKPGASIRSGRVLVLRSDSPFSGLESYAARCGAANNVKLNPIINGWCSWYYTHLKIDETSQLQNAAFIAKHLKAYGMEWVQVDNGFQRSYGDWEGNEQFPHGMKWFAGQVRLLGLKPGIWVAPVAISDDSEIAKKHRDWLVHNPDGSLYVIEGQPAQYGLDITHPQARQWVFDLFKTIAEDWGYDFIKIDYVEWTLLAAKRYYDPSVSRAQAYRMLIETIRKAIGPDRHLLDCGPANETVGLADSVRIEWDSPRLTWDQYVKSFNSNAPAMAKRYYFHKRTWINDDDHLGLKLLTIPQSQAAASIVALSGGTLISGDQLTTLDPERLDILKRVFPTYGEAARPLDLFENPYPQIFLLPVRKDFERWWVLGYFNYDEKASMDRDIDLARLGLDPSKHYLAYEFWSQRLLPTAGGKLRLHFEPSSANLVAIRDKTGVPQVLGTTRHITQGAIELDDVRWDSASQTLSGVALGAPGMKWRLAMHIPREFALKKEPASAEQVAFTVISQDRGLLQAECSFAASSRVPWALKFSKKP